MRDEYPAAARPLHAWFYPLVIGERSSFPVSPPRAPFRVDAKFRPTRQRSPRDTIAGSGNDTRRELLGEA